MKTKGALTRFLGITGTALVWFPLLAPVLLTAVFFLQRSIIRVDYLMPAELFPAGLTGGGLLLWASLRAGARRGLIGWGLGLAAAFLVGGQGLAVLTGLASGDIEPAGVWFILVLACLAAYTLSLALMGVGGLLLLRDLSKSSTGQT